MTDKAIRRDAKYQRRMNAMSIIHFRPGSPKCQNFLLGLQTLIFGSSRSLTQRMNRSYPVLGHRYLRSTNGGADTRLKKLSPEIRSQAMRMEKGIGSEFRSTRFLCFQRSLLRSGQGVFRSSSRYEGRGMAGFSKPAFFVVLNGVCCPQSRRWVTSPELWAGVRLSTCPV
jgi:hypothetical protein